MTAQFTLYSTRTCGQRSHPEIVVPLAAASGLTPDWLIGYFESAVKSGKVFKAEESVQVGGGLVKLVEGDGGTLELWEPDFKSMPIEWVRGANETLRQLILQKSVAELVGARPDFAWVIHAGQVQEGWAARRVFEMHRNIPEDNHTGWSIETPEMPPPDRLVSIYDLGRQLPICVPFFALPTGADIEISPTRLAIEFAGRSVSSDDNPLLKRLLATAAR